MKIKRFILIPMIFFLTSAPLSAGTVSWDNLGGGLWSTSANWSSLNVPGAADDIVINYGIGIITSSSDSTIKTLILGGTNKLIVSSTGKLNLGAGTISVEFGHTTAHQDYCSPVSLPADFGNGALFSVWTKIPVPLNDGDSRGNMTVLYVNGSNWNALTIVGNIGRDTSTNTLRYNANFSFGGGGTAFIGDFCTYYSTPSDNVTLAQANDWVWVAWQIIVNPDKTMTFRQWLKFGIDGPVFPAGNSGYDADWNWYPLPVDGEQITETLSFQPSNPSSFRLGDDNTYSGVNTPSNSYLCHARMQALSTKPTLPELNAIARANVADTTTWGDWELNWTDSGANLSDRSGHGHNLSIQSGGALYQGVLGPAFP